MMRFIAVRAVRAACAVWAVWLVAILATGTVLAQSEGEDQRFEVSAEKGLPTILSGPDLKDVSNFAGRFGFSPSHNFQLTLMYEKLEGTLATDDDVLGNFFIERYKKKVNSRTSFVDATLDDRDVDMRQIELGIVKTIPLGGKWESYMGIGVGSQNSSADITWTGATRKSLPVNASLSEEANNEFFTSVRGGIRYRVTSWFAGQINLRIVPIGKMLGEDFNSLELNAGVVFRFGKF